MVVADGNPRVLVVEDNLLMAEAVCEILAARSAQPVGPAPTVAAALRLVEANPIDAAVLDIRLHADTSFPVCRVLRERGIPFVCATGSTEEEIPAALADATNAAKPFEPSELIEALNASLHQPTGG